MKKVSLFILLVIVLSTVLMAAVPTKMVRLTIINKSDPLVDSGDYAVYMKLTGSSVTDAFYYLTVPAGSRDEPTVKVFTVMSDVYDRETWQCNGVRSAGVLVVAGNMRLTFTQCGEVKLICRYWNDANDDGVLAAAEFVGSDICGRFTPTDFGLTWDTWVTGRTWRLAGEPRMEKVTYFRILRNTISGFPYDLATDWSLAYLWGGQWTTGCATYFWRSYTWRTPVGCEWFYQY